MNPELSNPVTVEETKERHPVFRVTKFSQYFALVLFVALPFIGGWIGYTYAPLKVVEVERVITRESTMDVEKNQPIKKELLGYTREGGWYAIYKVDQALLFEATNFTEPEDVPPKLSGVQVDSLKLIPSPGTYSIYAVDSTHVYCLANDEELDADPESFTYFSMEPVPQTDNYAWIYAADKASVFFNCDKIEDADLATFRVLDTRVEPGGLGYKTLYALDKDNVYFNGKKVIGADPRSFTINSAAVVGMYANEASAYCGEEPCIYVSPFFQALSLYGSIPLLMESKYVPSITFDAFDNSHRYLLGQVAR